ncbi:THUMP DOMAIN-CONTAINING PROTEIN 1 [Salix purpurea]|uniref:THUMP DOMAIN-CONTAINING PROTEIN 1 n=1 Tax=Salix purpurea TaxID=77065 RepID=A0A9Q1A255_SALPP|nr:THUMP DOMAIN-CONTAINING PROTEIN 1 [Salix purpurea]
MRTKQVPLKPLMPRMKIQQMKSWDLLCLENEKSECQTEEKTNQEDCKNDKRQESEAEELPAKKKCTETCAPKSVAQEKVEEKSIDKLIEDELKELGDKNKRRFLSLDSGCNGVIFVQMRKIDGDPCPKDIVQHMMTSAASTRKHMSRFILRVLPIEVACYASEEEISRAIAPVVEKYFPVDTQDPQKGICPPEKEVQIIESQKVDFGPSHLVQDTISPGVAAEFAVMYEARANSGIDRMKIINSVAKSVPGPHKVDLSNPDKTIVVEIVKTLCLIGVIEKYKELSKYNLRQLTSSEQK